MGLAKKGIYIKKSRRGDFTRWCKSQGLAGVNTECIAKGKAAGKRRKKQAVFAENAMRWRRRSK